MEIYKKIVPAAGMSNIDNRLYFKFKDRAEDAKKSEGELDNIYSIHNHEKHWSPCSLCVAVVKIEEITKHTRKVVWLAVTRKLVKVKLAETGSG